MGAPSSASPSCVPVKSVIVKSPKGDRKYYQFHQINNCHILMIFCILFLHFLVNDLVKEISAPVFVNACGPWAGKMVDMLAARCPRPGAISPLPVKPRKRSVFLFNCKPTDGLSASACEAAAVSGDSAQACSPRTSPLVIDPSGVWFRSEGDGGNFICGMSPLEANSSYANPENGNYINSDGHNILTHDPDCDSVEALCTPDHALFDEFIWPILYQRVPAFGDLKLKSAWAGFYEYNTFDQVGTVWVLDGGFNGAIATW